MILFGHVDNVKETPHVCSVMTAFSIQIMMDMTSISIIQILGAVVVRVNCHYFYHNDTMYKQIPKTKFKFIYIS